MLDHYKTVKGYGEEIIIIKKSRFIGYAHRVESEEEAQAFIEQIKKKHWDATHNCSAYQIGDHDEIQRSSDDGEPSGTAGKPILEVIRKQGLKNVVIVVTRYFGGIMLGAGGLIRAYGQTAVEGIKAATVVERILHRIIKVQVDYTWVGKLENEFLQKEISIYHTDYLDVVTFHLLTPVGEEEKMMSWITNLTNGQAHYEMGELSYKETKI